MNRNEQRHQDREFAFATMLENREPPPRGETYALGLVLAAVCLVVAGLAFYMLGIS